MPASIQKIEFPSSSSDKTYEVTKWADNTLSCNCRGWAIKRPGQDRSCTHTKQVIAALHMAQRPMFETAMAPTPKEMKAIASKLVAIASPIFFKPMFAQPIERSAYDAVMKNDRYIAEPKFDGQRALVFIDKGITTACFSRLGNDLLKTKANGVGWLSEVKWPFDQAVLDAELCSESGKCRAAEDAAHARSTAGLELGLILFDLLAIDGTDLKASNYTTRRIRLEQAFEGFEHEQIRVTLISTDAPALWKAWVEELGGEGIMLKDKESRYLPGNRSPKWLKLKFETTVDVAITGVTDKAGYNGKKYKTHEAALTYGYWDGKQFVTVGQGGLGDMVGDKSKLEGFIGQVAEMRCAGIMPSGALRNGFFVRWRDDKTAKECTMPGLKGE